MINPLGWTAEQNPLLDIDLSFNAYLSARTRSFKEHVVGGKLDYAFDADFSLRQKLYGMPGWSKIDKKLLTNDIPNIYRKVFQSAETAGSLRYPNVYDAAKICAERLKVQIPVVYVRNLSDKLDIFSISAPGTEECIILTSGLYDCCDKEELIFLIGRECGHIQNNHCIYKLSAPYFDKAQAEEGIYELKPLEIAIITWFRYATITSDRAGIICLDDPGRFTDVFDSLYQKGIIPKRRKLDEFIIMDRLRAEYAKLRKTSARNIALDSSFNFSDRRILAGMEFVNCETLYNWRTDLEKSVHAVNKQNLEIRCDIIIGAKE